MVRIQSERINLAQEAAELGGSGEAGAVVTFTGYCRDEQGQLSGLEIEHYPGMAEQEISGIVREAIKRWTLTGCRVVHRFGMIRAGEEIVSVACSAEHRGEAFEATEFLMDFLKTRAPFWKREHLRDGSVGAWVESKDTDNAATDRWHRL